MMKMKIDEYFLHNLADAHIDMIKIQYPDAPILKHQKGDLIPQHTVFMGESGYGSIQEAQKEIKRRNKHHKVELINDGVKITYQGSYLPLVQFIHFYN